MVALALLPSLESQQSNLRVVLVDPVLNMADEALLRTRDSVAEETKHPKSAEDYLANNPRWSPEDARWKVIGATKFEPDSSELIFQVSPVTFQYLSHLTCLRTMKHNRPWSFTHLLPSPSSDLDLIILGADPTLGATFTPAEALALASSHPKIKTAFVSGASHSIHREFPDVLVSVVLSGETTGGALQGADAYSKVDTVLGQL